MSIPLVILVIIQLLLVAWVFAHDGKAHGGLLPIPERFIAAFVAAIISLFMWLGYAMASAFMH